MHRTIRIAAVAAVLALVLGAWLFSSPAVAQDKGLVGKQVIVMLATGPNPQEVIEDLGGTVGALDTLGITLKVDKRTLTAGTSRRPAEYKATLFIPWSSVLYVKQLP
jgi:hypothetical protein